MTPFEKALEFVLKFEGEYSNDPRDSGGETIFGISRRANPNWPGWALVDTAKTSPNFPSSLANNTGLTQAVEALYLEKYWKAVGCDKLPSALALLLFDSAVNQGPAKAPRLLQASLGIKQDGIIGDETVGAATNKPIVAAIVDFAAKRAAQYAIHPQITTYGYGWYRRLTNAVITAITLIISND